MPRSATNTRNHPHHPRPPSPFPPSPILCPFLLPPPPFPGSLLLPPFPYSLSYPLPLPPPSFSPSPGSPFLLPTPATLPLTPSFFSLLLLPPPSSPLPSPPFLLRSYIPPWYTTWAFHPPTLQTTLLIPRTASSPYPPGPTTTPHPPPSECTRGENTRYYHVFVTSTVFHSPYPNPQSSSSMQESYRFLSSSSVTIPNPPCHLLFS